MKVVGLTGYSRSGKDTFADHLVENYGFTKMSFATPLKEMLRTLDPYIGISYDGVPIRVTEALANAGGDENIVKRRYPDYVALLQRLGTDCIRAVDENFWAGRVADKLGALDYDAKVVISDVRFDNESLLIWDGQRANGRSVTGHYYEGWTFRVDRHGCEPANGHIADRNVKFISVHDSISNNGTLSEFYRGIDMLLEEWGVIEEGVTL